ncbi:MAG: hypothetical protein IIA44_10920 [Acidobacteria bacterium]|nr:hypothetical protein [Acidobacteriota bacterium]
MAPAAQLGEPKVVTHEIAGQEDAAKIVGQNPPKQLGAANDVGQCPFDAQLGSPAIVGGHCTAAQLSSVHWVGSQVMPCMVGCSQVGAPSQVDDPSQVAAPMHVWISAPQVGVPSHEGYNGHVRFPEQVCADPAHVGSAVQVIGWQVSIAAQVACMQVKKPLHVAEPWHDGNPTMVALPQLGSEAE